MMWKIVEVSEVSVLYICKKKLGLKKKRKRERLLLGLSHYLV